MIYSERLLPDRTASREYYTLPMSVIGQIKEVIAVNQDVFEIRRTETVFAADGYNNDLYLACNGKETDIHAVHLGGVQKYGPYIRGKKVVKALKVMGLLNEIREILVSHGIESIYFRFYPEH